MEFSAQSFWKWFCRTKPPMDQSWGLRIAYVIDPSGVLWHVAQRRLGVQHDQ
jgi:hypothetical protein